MIDDLRRHLVDDFVRSINKSNLQVGDDSSRRERVASASNLFSIVKNGNFILLLSWFSKWQKRIVPFVRRNTRASYLAIVIAVLRTLGSML